MSEPFSANSCLFAGKKQGISSNSVPIGPCVPEIVSMFQHLGGDFPVLEIREVPGMNRETYTTNSDFLS